MLLDETKSIEYLRWQSAILTQYNEACNAAALYFELDKAKDIDARIKSLEQHYDQLVFWRFIEISDQLPEELRPRDSTELDDLIMFMHSLNPVQPIKFKKIQQRFIMKLRFLYIWYLLRLGLISRAFSYPWEWRYDYDSMSDADVLALMASVLAGRNGSVVQFELRWNYIKERHFKHRENIQYLELQFKNKLGLRVIQYSIDMFCTVRIISDA